MRLTLGSADRSRSTAVAGKNGSISTMIVASGSLAMRGATASGSTTSYIACATTIGAFGLLALSEHPVLADLGLTAAVGIGASVLLAPTTLVVARRTGEAGR